MLAFWILETDARMRRLNKQIKRVSSMAQKARGRPMSFLVWKAMDLSKKRWRKHTYRLEPSIVSRERLRKLFPHGSNSSLRDHLNARENFRFFFDQIEVPDILNRLSASDSGYVQRVLGKAERICQHRIPILATGETQLGDCIDWSRDYHSGLRWGKKYSFVYD